MLPCTRLGKLDRGAMSSVDRALATAALFDRSEACGMRQLVRRWPPGVRARVTALSARAAAIASTQHVSVERIGQCARHDPGLLSRRRDRPC